MAAKVFVFGSINGRLAAAFGKLAALNAKNNFSFAMVAGDLFDDVSSQDPDELKALLDGQIAIPCPTYFTVGTRALPPDVLERISANEEVAPNLHFLGKRSITNTSDGVRIVTLGGLLDGGVDGGIIALSKDESEPFHTEIDARTLRGANNADILLTTMWPADIWKNSAKAKELGISQSTAPSSQSIAGLCTALKPRYHFSISTETVCFEREPFFPPPNPEEADKGVPLTRFISLAPWGNAAKAKSMYAFTINRETILNPPPGSTLTPFLDTQKALNKRSADTAGFNRFAHGGHERDRRGRKHRREKSPPPGPDRCFFCLSNVNLPRHMIVSIADNAYMVTAKGPLPTSETFEKLGLNFPCHIIIAPIAHAPSISTAALAAEASQTYSEMSRFRESVQKMVAKRSDRKLGVVTFEINRERNIHVHWQLLPIPASILESGIVTSGFIVMAKDMMLGKLEEKTFGTADDVEGDYLRIWTWVEVGDGEVQEKCFLMKLDPEVRFDLQYPRKVMANLLRLEDRVVWRDVEQTVDEEKNDADKLREAFQEWDFTLDEDEE
ncbi:hypothetical protein OQA88_1695 [Cercophora sp. LCS_1]